VEEDTYARLVHSLLKLSGGLSRLLAHSRGATEHLGLLPPQLAFDAKSQPTQAMHPAPEPIEYDFGSPEDLAVQDVLSDEFERLWSETGRNNRRAFEHIFRPIPNDTIRTWEEYNNYLKPRSGFSKGHVTNQKLSANEVKKELSKIRGHLVDMPVNFLSVSQVPLDGRCWEGR
jgi:phospholipase D1/2